MGVSFPGPKAPCGDCENRKTLCHSNCGIYQDYKKQREQFTNKIRTDKTANYNVWRQQADRYKKLGDKNYVC